MLCGLDSKVPPAQFYARAALTEQQPQMSLTTTSNDQRKPIQHRISSKVRIAIDAMVWQGLKRDEAADKAGLKDNSLYIALRKPDVKRYYLDQLDVLRDSERARNFHTLCEVRDQTSNQMARVNAIAAMERIDEQAVSASAPRQAAGITIVIETGSVLAQNRSIDAKPLIEHEPVRDTE